MSPDFDLNAFMSALGQTLIVALKEGNNKSLSLPQQNIKPFSGCKSDNLTSFIFQVSDLFDSRKLSLDDRLVAITSFFSDNALQWYLQVRKSIQDGSRPRFGSWESFIVCLKRAFEPPSTPMLLRRQLSTLKQTGSIHEYVEKFRNITAQITDMNPLDTIHYFIEGLRDQTKTELYYRDPSSIDEAIHLASLFDSSKFGSKPGFQKPRHQIHQQITNAESPQNVGPMPMEIGSLNRPPRNTSSNFSSKKKKCTYCNFFGHIEQECRKKASKGSTNSSSNSISVEETYEPLECLTTHSSPLFITEVMLEGLNAKALVDSGATHNFFSSSFVSTHQAVFAPLIDASSGFSAAMVDGSPNHSEGVLKKAKLTIGKLTCTVSGQIIKVAKYDVILGKPWLFQFNPLIDWRENRMEVTISNDVVVVKGVRNKTPSTPIDGIQESLRREIDQEAIILNCHVAVDSSKDDSNSPRLHAIAEWKTKYPEVFSELTAPPKERLTTHAIKCSDPSPIALPAYRMSPLELQSLKTQLDELLLKGFIKPSMSPWSAPAIFVKKKDGTLRLCIDYRALNRVTVKHHFPIPRVDDLLDQLSSATIFSKLDLASGYYQVAIAPEDTEKTAFKTRYGLYEFLVMPFGLTNAPATFQKLMNEIFSQALDSYVIVYLDDILVYSKDIESHEIHLNSVFSVLMKNGLKVKESKCYFYLKRIEFLGYVIESGTLSVDQSKVSAIKGIRRPNSLRHVRSFLGMTGFYRRFIQNYADIALPLTKLLAHQEEFKWSYEQEIAFENLKKCLASAPILTLPDFSQPFNVTCDASGEAISGVLSQNRPGEASVIAFESRKLSPQERNYAVYELEMLAIIHCLKVWRCYLEGRRFIVFTDHAALKHLKTQKTISKRVARWMDFLASFDFEIEYKPGKTNYVADALTRLELNTIQAEDVPEQDWPLLLLLLNDGNRRAQIPKDLLPLLQKEKEHFILEDESIKRIVDSNTIVPYIPCAQRLDHISKLHCGMGHIGIEATTNLARTRGWWPNMRSDIKKWVTACSVCAKALSPRKPSSEELHPIELPLQPFKRWGIDFIGRLPTSKKGNRWIIVAIDHFTRWPVAIATPDATTATVAKFIHENIFCSFGTPDEILTDRGSNFLAETLKEYLRIQKVKHLKTTAYHPRTNGMTERFNGSLISIMRKYANEQPELWDLYLNQALFTCRIKAHTSTGLTPFYLVYGLEPTIPGDPTNPQIILEFNDEVTAENWRIQQIKKLELERAAAIEKNKKLQERSKQAFDEANKSSRRYTENELVYRKKEVRGKWDNYWDGPFRIATVGETGIYKLKDLAGQLQDNWIHGDRLKPVARISGSEVLTSENLMPSKVEP